MRCGRCGNENSEGNRFCGMCGTSLVAQTPGPAMPVATTADKAAVPAVGPPEDLRLPARYGKEASPVAPSPISTAPSVVRSSAPSPIVSGPSFLGLNKAGDGRSGDDRSRQPSGNLDYLLEDEDEPRRGRGKLIVVVIALVLLGGFGYLRWKQGGFAFLNGDRKPVPTAEPSQSSQDSAGTSGSVATPDAATPTPANPSTANPSAANSSPITPDTGTSAAAPPANGAASGGAETGGQQVAPTSTAPAQSTTTDNSSPAKPQDDISGEKSTASDSPATGEAEPSKAEPHAQAAKPSAARTRERKPTPVTPVDPMTEAERFIYGRGVPQDCDRGLRLLKPAAAQANPKAMIALGTLYSSGTCTPRDLPTAYRWFALALHKQPDNQPLQDDLQKLWSQMTQPERLLAIKLSQ